MVKRLLIVVVLILLPCISQATTYHYVWHGLTTGNNDGSSWANAWRDVDDVTANRTALEAEVATQPVYIYFKKGVTVLNDTMQIRLDGASDVNRFIFTTDSGDTGTTPVFDCNGSCASTIDIEGDYLTFDGLTVQGGTSVNMDGYHESDSDRRANYITIKNCTIQNSTDGQGIYCSGVSNAASATGWKIQNNYILNNGSNVELDHGMYLSRFDNAIIEYNYVEGNAAWGIHLRGECDNDIVRYNFVKDNTGSSGGGIDIKHQNDTSTNNKVYGNVLIGNYIGIRIGDGSGNGPTGNLIYNNTVYDSVYAGISIDGTSVDAGTIYNNIIWGTNNGQRVYVINSQTTPSDYNIIGPQATGFIRLDTTAYDTLSAYQSASGKDANSLTSNPDFTNASGDDLTLVEGSPAIDSGTSDPGQTYDDILDPGSSWTQSVSTLDQDSYGFGWERGAYIFEGTGEDTTPPVISNLLPSGAQTCDTNPLSVTLQVTTNENATCKYDTSDVAYDSMTNTFASTGGTSHSDPISLACDSSYTYYVRCSDAYGNKNTTSTMLSFSIAAETPYELACGTTVSTAGTYTLDTNLTCDGTWLTLTGSGITVDLDGHTVIYNQASAGNGINVNGSGQTITNGYLIQGDDADGDSPAVKFYSNGGHTVSYMGIKMNGVVTGDMYAAGVDDGSSGSEIHHVFVEHHGSTSNISYSPRCIRGDQRTTAGMLIHDNILEGCHQGISLDYLGLDWAETQPASINISYVYNNRIQHERTPGTKAPFGISLGKSYKVNIYNNQLISDNGRGIMLDGLGQGVPTGTEYCNVYSNRIDVNYEEPAEGGSYPENHVVGGYDRYSSGNNNWEDNIVLVDNNTGAGDAATECFFCGSDSTDSNMINLLYDGNVCVNLHSLDSAFRYAVFDGDTTVVSNNQYIAADFWLGNWDYYNSGGETPSMSNNTEITPTSYTPAIPTGLYLRKFTWVDDSTATYVLFWNLNGGESQTYEYKVYKDGTAIDMSLRGGDFYVDVDVTGAHTYTVSAVNLNGDESAQSASVSTADAYQEWSQVQTPVDIFMPVGIILM